MVAFKDEVCGHTDAHRDWIGDNVTSKLAREKTVAAVRIALRDELSAFKETTRDDCIAVDSTLKRIEEALSRALTHGSTRVLVRLAADGQVLSSRLLDAERPTIQ